MGEEKRGREEKDCEKDAQINEIDDREKSGCDAKNERNFELKLGSQCAGWVEIYEYLELGHIAE